MKNIFIIAKGVMVELVRRKDFYLIFALLFIIMLYSATISFGGETGFVRYFKEIGVSLTYIFSVIIVTTFASREIPQEIEAKTIYPILAHPVSRGQFICGKFLGVLIISVISFTMFYGTLLVSLALKKDASPPILLMEGYILHICLLSFFAAMTVFFSLFLSIAANVGISMILYFATNWFGANLPGYIFLPHPELFDIKERIVHTGDIVPLWALSFLVLYAICYSAIFLLAANLNFSRRDL